MKGQISSELMIVVGFILLLFIPLMFVLYLKLGDVTTDLSVLQAHFSVIRIASLVNAIGHMGDGSAIITEVYLPQNVQQLTFRGFEGGGEVEAVIRLNDMESEIAQPTSFPMSTAQGIELNQPGRYRIEIKNVDGEVLIEPIRSEETRA
jgi:hypothetical protein